MNDRTNKTSICSIVSLDIVDFSKKTDAEQIEIINQLNDLINHAVVDIAQEDRTILDTSDGAAIACNGALEDALEDALFISLTIRDEILKNNTNSSAPLYVRFGINLGPVRVSNGNNDQPSITGEGLDEARRIMSFAKPNQILVSRAYYEVASKLSQEISQMFEYNDMHAHEHEVYSVRLLKDQLVEDAPVIIAADDSQSGNWQSIAGKINFKYTILGLMVLAGLFVLAKLASTPTEPTIILENPAVAETPASTSSTVTAKPANDGLLPTETLETAPPKAEPVKTDTNQKKTNKTVKKTETPTKAVTKAEASDDGKDAEKPAGAKTENKSDKEKSGWQTFTESIKQGSERKCTQAEIALGQCR
ncbi:MAG TPA: adenylate/guanylate cyclase domain-containing protein [Methylotenera sp.]|nr:adenylate/guanylate cyclase domain-containing protein [Methylotenera sp.]HPV45543.1 adenylate/guanylate cyclase domain-containing protein [Methylotenera sp.]